MLYLITFTSISAYLLRYALEKLITISVNRFKRFLMLFSFWILSGMVIFIGDPVNIGLSILFFLFTIFVSCEGSYVKKLTIGLMFASTVFSFNALRDNYLIDVYSKMYTRESSLLTSCLSSLLFSFLLCIGTVKFAPEKNYELSEHMWKLLLLLTIPAIGIVLSVVLLYDRKGNISLRMIYHHKEYAILLVIALFSFIGLLWAVTVLARQQELNRQILFADMNRSYYEAMEQQHFEIRRLKHDMANHLQVISALPEEQQKEYIRKLSENTALTQTISYCGDTTVNAVLSVKDTVMKRYGIDFTWTIDIPKELPFAKTDICAVFANALDNALEACMKLEPGQRKIILEGKAQTGLFCLRVKNPVSPPDISMNTDFSVYKESLVSKVLPKTSKEDKRDHGLGLRSIKEIVTRYRGMLEWKTENGIFELFLYMPL